MGARIAIGVGVLLAFVLLLWRLDVVAGKLDLEKEQHEATKTALRNTELAAEANLANLTSVNNRLSVCVAERRADVAAANAAAARAIDDRARLEREMNEELNRLRAIYESDETARSWADAIVPAAIADRLRRRAAGESGSPD